MQHNQTYPNLTIHNSIMNENELRRAIRAAAARRYIAEHGITMLQFAVYDSALGKYVMQLEG